MANIKLTNVKLSFPSVFEHGSFGGESTGKYEATFLIPKDTEEGKKAYEQLVAEAERLMKENKVKVPKDRWALKDGDETDDEYAQGHWILKTANKNRPTLVDRKGHPVTKEDDEVNPMFFGGATVNAVVGLWLQNNSFGKRINGNLAGIQYVSGDIATDGFGDTGVVPPDVFGAIDDDDEEL